MLRRSAYLACSAALLAAAAPAFAVTTPSAADGLKAMQQYNAIVFGNMTSGHDVEGKLYVGGSLSGNTQVGIGARDNHQGYLASDRATLVVGENLSGNVKVDNGINLSTVNARIGGNASGLGINNNSATGRATIGGDFAGSGFNPNSTKTVAYGGNATNLQQQDAAFAVKDGTLAAGGANDLKASIATETSILLGDIQALSDRLKSLTANATLATYKVNPQDQTSRVKFDFSNINLATTDYAVVNVTDLSVFAPNGQNAGDFDILLPTGANGKPLTTIVNVYGTSVTSRLNFTPGADPYNQHIIWNFVDATTIDFKTNFNGSVLALKAAISNSTPIEGSVVAKSFNQGGEVHLGTFAGNTNFLSLNPTGAVPEPAVWAQLIAGFGVVGVALRRRRRSLSLAA